MKRHMLHAVLALGLLGVAGITTAQTYAITGGTIHTLDRAGTIEHGTLVIKDGTIIAVGGADTPIPDGAERIDATGKIVTPGLFDPESQFGVVEVSQVTETRDASVSGRNFSAAFDVADAINPRSVLIPVNRIAGVTRAMVAPTVARGGHVITGRGAIIDLGAIHAFIYRDPAATFAVLGETGARLAGGSRAAALMSLRQALRDAMDFGGKHAAAKPESGLSRADLAALQPVVDGKQPLVVAVNRASDIEAALRLARDYHLRLVVSGGAEAWMVARQLATAQVPVILDPLEDLPVHFESLGATLENAARLHRAGVLVAFATRDTHKARNLTQAAGNAVANGLPWQSALEAITLNPAKIYGVGDRLGSLATGKVADVVIWNGDPLELSTSATQVFIAGRKIPMVSRQTLLRDRYLQQMRGNNALPAAYTQPESL